MKTMLTTALSLLVTASCVLASEGAEAESLGFMATLFIAFAVLIVLFQFIPCLLLLSGMVKGIFSASDKKVAIDNSK
jgi:hypothetical protein